MFVRRRATVKRFNVEKGPLNGRLLIKHLLGAQFFNEFRTTGQLTILGQMLETLKTN